MAEGRFVAYYRVSTDAQGRSGLGLEAQQKAVADYLNGNGADIVAEFVEVESGSRDNRPELNTALEACKQHKAVLVIAKLDRLSRNATFLFTLRDAGVDILAVDMPEIPSGAIGRFIFGQMALTAELERGLISERTKAALAAAKARGVQLGKHGKVLARQNRATAEGFARGVAPIVNELRRDGFSTIRKLTDELNRRAVPTAKGGKWHIGSTHRLLKRLETQPGS